MITLITGVPGSGKSLLAVEVLVANWKSEKMRPAFANIGGLDHDKLRTFTLDEPHAWYELPEGSIIVIDECQKHFPVRASGSAVPDWVARFETHRHKGFDIFLITQHPSLMDKHLRKLVGLHQHCYRPFGMDRRTVFEWNTVNEDPEPNQSESNALKKRKPFDKTLYTFYKSAEIHTHKKRLPWKPILMLGAAIAVVPALGGLSYIALNRNVFNGEKKVDVAKGVTKTPSETVVKAREEKSLTPILPSRAVEQPGPIFAYRGYMRIDGFLRVLIEETVSGQTFDISDFDGYKKDGIDILVFPKDGDGRPYKVRSSELVSLLP